MSENNRMIDYKMYSIRPYYGPAVSWEIEERELKSYRYMLAVPAPLSKEQEETILKMISLFETKRAYPEHDDIKLLVPDLKWR